MLLVAALGATIAFGGARPAPPTKGPKAKAAAKRPAVRRAIPPARHTPPTAPRPRALGGPANNGTAMYCVQPLPGEPQVCPCVAQGGVCRCAADCWCQGSHSGGTGSTGTSATGTSSTTGDSSGSDATTGDTDSTTTGSTDGPVASDGGATTTSTTSTATTSATADPSNGSSTDAGTGYTAGTTAGAPTGGGSAGDWDGSKSLITVPGVLDNGKVSGTNVDAAVTISMTPPTGGAYDTIFLSKVTAKIGGETDSEFDVPIAALDPATAVVKAADPPVPIEWKFRLRFASTRFKDAAAIVLNTRVAYRLSLSNTNDQSPVYHYDVHPFHVVAYNKGLALQTDLYVPNCVDYVYDTAPVEPNYDLDSRNAIPSATDGLRAVDRLDKKLPGQMNHALITSGPDLDKESVLGALNGMTAFFAYTHGETDGFFPSYGTSNPQDAPNAKDATAADKMIFSTQYGWDSEVGWAVRGGTPPAGSGFLARTPRTATGIPLPSMVVLHACSGVGGGVEPALRAFGLLAPNNPQTNPDGTLNATVMDRALGAFGDIVDSRLFSHKDPKKTHLSDHAKQIYLYLAQGQTLYEAVTMTEDKTNGDGLVPFHDSCKPDDQSRSMNMNVLGDKAARLVSVYNGKLDPPKSGPLRGQSGGYPYEWYLVNPS